MFNLIRASLPAVAVLTLACSGAVQADPGKWKQVAIKDSVKVKLPDGSKRELKPSCSGGPIKLPDGTVVQAPTDYSFFISEGNSKKILVSLDGGGACWDSPTCLLSPLDPRSFGGRATYSPLVDETPEGLAQAGGILDTDNPENPYQDYTKIFVPYCSADIHWGSKDTTYYFPPVPQVGDLAFKPWTIHHRGTDNFLAVLDWLNQNGVNFKNASDVSVAGASAGAYGANLAFAYVAEMAGDDTRLSLVSDSGIGVIDDPAEGVLPFYGQAIYDGSGDESWGVIQNFPKWVFPYPEGFLAAGADDPISFIPSFITTLSWYKEDARLATTTSNLDAVQIGFYILMKGIDPTDGLAVQQAAGEWYCSMEAMTTGIAGLGNYRSFIQYGGFHTFIFGGKGTSGPVELDDVFYDAGANGFALSHWVADLIDPEASLPESVPAPIGGIPCS